ncbi:MAG: hypothetical protein ACWGOW_02470 [Gammaproteobacteria bacterium]
MRTYHIFILITVTFFGLVLLWIAMDCVATILLNKNPARVAGLYIGKQQIVRRR